MPCTPVSQTGVRARRLDQRRDVPADREDPLHRPPRRCRRRAPRLRVPRRERRVRPRHHRRGDDLDRPVARGDRGPRRQGDRASRRREGRCSPRARNPRSRAGADEVIAFAKEFGLRSPSRRHTAAEDVASRSPASSTRSPSCSSRPPARLSPPSVAASASSRSTSTSRATSRRSAWPMPRATSSSSPRATARCSAATRSSSKRLLHRS